MLTLTSKKYEIEEQIQLLDESNELVYEFTMKITSDELKKLQNALLGKDTLKMAKKVKQMENLDMSDIETEKAFELMENMDKKAFELIGVLCFKEHKEEFIEKGGIVKYEEMVAITSDFLLTYFIKKQTKRQNTITSNLEKIGKN